MNISLGLPVDKLTKTIFLATSIPEIGRYRFNNGNRHITGKDKLPNVSPKRNESRDPSKSDGCKILIRLKGNKEISFSLGFSSPSTAIDFVVQHVLLHLLVLQQDVLHEVLQHGLQEVLVFLSEQTLDYMGA